MVNLQTIKDMKEYLNTSNVTNMATMFYGCSMLENIDLSKFDTRSVENMISMFYDCGSLEKLDLSSFDTHKVVEMDQMFYDCRMLGQILVGDGWSTESVTSSGNMFYQCWSLVGSAGTYFDDDHIDAGYAHVDGGKNDPGYLTKALNGDVNGDGAVDVADIAAIIDVMAGSGLEFKDRADVNADSSVDVADIATIIDIMAGK